ncbi:MAG: hypothetical protein ACYTGB_16405, partial [Planctomycetota bacterium]
GLGAKYDKEVIADPMAIDRVLGIAAADGTLYLVTGAGSTVPNWSAQRLVALNRDGTFQRTLIPLPSTAAREQIEALGGVPVEVGGRTVPMVVHVNQRRTTAFWPLESSGQVAVTPGGQFLTLHASGAIGLVDTTGGETPLPYLGPRLLPEVPAASFYTYHPDEGMGRSYLAVSGDGRYAYFSGMAKKKSPYAVAGTKGTYTPPWPAVYRVRLPERTPAEVFFGDPEQPGGDEGHLGSNAHGMASDGRGHLLICDPANQRVVVVAEADGRLVGSLAAENPEFVAADPESGAVYLLKVRPRASAEVVKLSGWKDPRPIDSVQLRSPSTYLQWRFTADTSARPAVLWASNGPQLFRIEDLGDRLSDARQVNADTIGDGSFVGLTVDHYREEPEIYARIVCRSYDYRFARYNEKTGKVEVVKADGVHHPAAGSCLEVGPDGNLYVQGWDAYLYKFDRKGKPLKWDVPFVAPEGVQVPGGTLPTHAIFSRVIMVYMTHTLGIRHDGHLFVFEGHPTAGKNGTHALFEYAPSGAGGPGPGEAPIVWRASDSVVGPRFDQQGNIYVAEQIRPADQLIPPEFAGVTGPVTIESGWPNDDPRAAIAQMYGSIVKFSPRGGSFDFAFYQARTDEPEPDPAARTIEAASWIGQVHDRFSPNRVTGALWMHMGVSQINLHYCNCENTRFDVDPFGRVWYPDLGRYRVGVLDTNGNLITTFGSYGNAESRGPDSPDRALAEPEIAFAWLIGVGATDRYAYMGDSLNRRLLRAKLVYAAEETCEVK